MSLGQMLMISGVGLAVFTAVLAVVFRLTRPVYTAPEMDGATGAGQGRAVPAALTPQTGEETQWISPEPEATQLLQEGVEETVFLFAGAQGEAAHEADGE